MTESQRSYWTGTLVRLRAMEPEDAEHFYQINQEVDVDRSLEMVWPPTSLASQKEWVDEASRKPDRSTDDLKFVIEALESGDIVGSIDTHHCDPRNGKLEYGLAVSERFRGKGYAAEAILLVLRFYFFERRYQKANPAVFDFNESSKRLHEKLGFKLEGVRRRDGYSHGDYHDLLLFGMTVEEFRERHPDYCPPWKP